MISSGFARHLKGLASASLCNSMKRSIALQPAAGEFGEEALDSVQPGA
jgi:hypothetical protein